MFDGHLERLENSLVGEYLTHEYDVLALEQAVPACGLLRKPRQAAPKLL